MPQGCDLGVLSGGKNFSVGICDGAPSTAHSSCYLIYHIAFGKRKTAKSFHFMLSLLSRSESWQKLQNVVKNFLTIISNMS